MEYHPNNPPSDPAKLPDFLRQEFRRMQQAMMAPQKAMRLVALHVEPTKLSDGMIVYADGTDWDPGSGSGMYYYKVNVWVFLG